ncbi:molybdate transport system substrate-binding protein [Roseovarius nanhaiticus]|uniref:Molybdate transport system substrate-binding protein n=1 Tax=Roseovarius nanhaiticus TaxID=573024 RepID=A0A1N7FNE6_9RHOB|nr:molybdate ABC transporter substrate-binding protein [Roseovarius nanhaiticus]SEK49898.1 molybdate transport system substrate-binding protein [Roseovarius nanhaiticus]SIS01841.1 molybdate transport system substrate-binding protein [Roseovarius nanhaiticus]
MTGRRAATEWMRHACLALIAASLPVMAQADAPRATIFAAASLQGVLSEIAALYPGEATVSVAGSGTIARQIANGAPADLAILANADWMDWLEDQGLIDPLRRTDLVGNSLVLIGPANAPDLKAVNAEALLARLNGGRMAIGQTMGVPAGIYGRQWLEAAGFWPALRPQLAETDNVRSALALVARGEAPLGVVYATDAAAEEGVRTLYAVPQEMHDPITYPLAELTDAGADLATFLRGAEARGVFLRHGFVPFSGAP